MRIQVLERKHLARKGSEDAKGAYVPEPSLLTGTNPQRHWDNPHFRSNPFRCGHRFAGAWTHAKCQRDQHGGANMFESGCDGSGFDEPAKLRTWDHGGT